MSKKLIGTGDIKIITINPTTKGNWIPPNEMREVVRAVGEVAYTLYSVYRTYPFTEAIDIEDAALAKILPWNQQKVQKYRLMLEKFNLYRTVRYGTKADGSTKMFVGADVIALFDAGLPCEILDNKAFNKLKREFGITSPIELVQQAHNIVLEYDANPDKYK